MPSSLLPSSSGRNPDGGQPRQGSLIVFSLPPSFPPSPRVPSLPFFSSSPSPSASSDPAFLSSLHAHDLTCTDACLLGTRQCWVHESVQGSLTCWSEDSSCSQRNPTRPGSPQRQDPDPLTEAQLGLQKRALVSQGSLPSAVLPPTPSPALHSVSPCASLFHPLLCKLATSAQ